MVAPVNLDLRSARNSSEPLGVGSLGRDVAAEGETRFVYMLVCENCLAPGRSLWQGRPVCGGCGREIVYDQREDGLRP